MQKINTMVLHEMDNVSVALEELMPGDEAVFKLDEKVFSVKVLEPVPIYHKISITSIEEGTPVYKYGQVIGNAVTHIKAGQHVHTHNLVSVREGVGR